MPIPSCHITNSLNFQKQFATRHELAHLLFFNFLIVDFKRRQKDILKCSQGKGKDTERIFCSPLSVRELSHFTKGCFTRHGADLSPQQPWHTLPCLFKRWPLYANTWEPHACKLGVLIWGKAWQLTGSLTWWTPAVSICDCIPKKYSLHEPEKVKSSCDDFTLTKRTM